MNWESKLPLICNESLHKKTFCKFQNLLVSSKTTSIENKLPNNSFWSLSHYDIIVRKKNTSAEDDQRLLLHYLLFSPAHWFHLDMGNIRKELQFVSVQHCLFALLHF